MTENNIIFIGQHETSVSVNEGSQKVHRRTTVKHVAPSGRGFWCGPARVPLAPGQIGAAANE